MFGGHAVFQAHLPPMDNPSLGPAPGNPASKWNGPSTPEWVFPPVPGRGVPAPGNPAVKYGCPETPEWMLRLLPLRIPVGMQPVIGMGGVVQPPGSPIAPRHMEVVAPPFAQMELDVEVMVPQEDEWLLPLHYWRLMTCLSSAQLAQSLWKLISSIL